MHVLIANRLPWMGGAERWAVHVARGLARLMSGWAPDDGATAWPRARRGWTHRHVLLAAANSEAMRERVKRLFDMRRMIDAYERLFDRAASATRRGR
jgi:hypothetical protein